MSKGVLLGTLCLNEMEWLPRLYEQHKNWPGLTKWVFVEAADKVYAATNPSFVSNRFLSVDGTSEYLQQLAAIDDRVVYIPFGLSAHDNPALCKVPCRRAYMNVANKCRPEIIVALDADEFYTTAHQQVINTLCRKYTRSFNGLTFRQRHIWRPPSISDQPLLKHEVKNGCWGVPQTRCWMWRPGMNYSRSHNKPNGAKVNLLGWPTEMPQCVHMGFASKIESRVAKHNYYIARGEGVTDHRKMYVKCKAAYEVWKPGDRLPCMAKVVPYNGPIPECFTPQQLKECL